MPSPMQAQIGATRKLASREAASVVESVLWQCGHASPTADMLARLAADGSGLSESEWFELLVQAGAHGMASLVFQNMAAAGLLPVMPAQVYAALKERYSTNLVDNRRTHRELSRIVQRLSAAQVPVVLLKGVSVEERYYATVGLRPVGDIDLLVHANDLSHAVEALTGLGYVHMAASRREEVDRALLYGEIKLMRDSAFVVEVHWALSNTPPYWKRLGADKVWRRTREEERQGYRGLFLDPIDDLLFLSVHSTAQHTDERLIWRVDIAELVQSRHADWDWATVTQRAITQGVATPLAVALSQAQVRLGLTVPACELEQLWQAADAVWERSAWSAAHSGFPYIRRFAYHFASLTGTTDRLLFLRYLADRGVQKLLHSSAAGRRVLAVVQR